MKHRFTIRIIIVLSLFLILYLTSCQQNAIPEEIVSESVEEIVAISAEEAVAKSAEEAVVESADEAFTESAEEAVVESTEEAVVESADEINEAVRIRAEENIIEESFSEDLFSEVSNKLDIDEEELALVSQNIARDYVSNLLETGTIDESTAEYQFQLFNDDNMNAFVMGLVNPSKFADALGTDFQSKDLILAWENGTTQWITSTVQSNQLTVQDADRLVAQSILNTTPPDYSKILEQALLDSGLPHEALMESKTNQWSLETLLNQHEDVSANDVTAQFQELYSSVLESMSQTQGFPISQISHFSSITPCGLQSNAVIDPQVNDIESFEDALSPNLPIDNLPPQFINPIPCISDTVETPCLTCDFGTVPSDGLPSINPSTLGTTRLVTNNPFCYSGDYQIAATINSGMVKRIKQFNPSDSDKALNDWIKDIKNCPVGLPQLKIKTGDYEYDQFIVEYDSSEPILNMCRQNEQGFLFMNSKSILTLPEKRGEKIPKNSTLVYCGFFTEYNLVPALSVNEVLYGSNLDLK